jgi:hypothetical protein
LNELLRRIDKSFADFAKVSPIPAPRLVDTLVELRSELAHHFAEEESGGCLEEAVSRCPSLSPNAKEVETQHPGLLANLDHIIRQASPTSQPSTIASLHRDFEKFAETLRQHEDAENRILHLGFGIGSDSVE